MSGYHLIGNGLRLYKHGSHLLRNPLYKTLTLAPDKRAYYAVAGSYNSAMPTAGVIDTTGSNILIRNFRSGKLMRKYYLNTTPRPTAYQIWRGVTTSHDPEFIFYQGAYSPSANNITAAHSQPEAFMQLCAYHFTIPQAYRDWGVVSATLSITHGGTIVQHGPPSVISTTYTNYFAANAPATLLPASSDWRTGLKQKLGIYQTIEGVEPTTLRSNASQDVDLATATMQGDVNSGSERIIWDNTYVSYYDGGIPVTTSPWVQSIALNSTLATKLNTNKQGWFVMTPGVSTSTVEDDDTENDYPCYSPGDLSGDPNRWLCCSYWGFGLRVTLEL